MNSNNPSQRHMVFPRAQALIRVSAGNESYLVTQHLEYAQNIGSSSREAKAQRLKGSTHAFNARKVYG